MARKRGGSHSRAVRRKGNKIWTANLFAELDPLSTVLSADMVVKGDFAPFKQITMRTVRGWLHLMPFTGSTLDDTVFMMICVVDEDIASTSPTLDPTVVSTYIDEDILWTGGATTVHDSNGVLIGSGGHFFDINVKTDRIIQEGQKLRFVYSNLDGTGEQMLSGVLRTLLITTA